MRIDITAKLVVNITLFQMMIQYTPKLLVIITLF